MKARKFILATLITLSSTVALAGDGYNRSLQMVKDFRESQAKLKGKQFFASQAPKTEPQQFNAQNDRERTGSFSQSSSASEAPRSWETLKKTSRFW